jgi:hypothetical protein
MALLRIEVSSYPRKWVCDVLYKILHSVRQSEYALGNVVGFTLVERQQTY